MRIVCISDTHGMTDNLAIPDGDVLVHAGDFCWSGRKDELVVFNEFLAKLPHKHKVFIAGNHDIPAEMCGSEFVKKQIPQGLYLQDSSVRIEGLKFYGSPWQPEFFNWAFNLPRGRELAHKWAFIPKDTDILITHGPPAGIMDMLSDGRRVGCADLRRYVGIVQPKVHIFGHIHEGYGMEEKDGILFVNASTCTGNYQPINPPIVVDIF